MKFILLILAVAVSFVAMTLISSLPGNTSIAQSRVSYSNPEKVLVRLSGYARAAETPEEAKLFLASAENNPVNSFSVVPKGKKLIITDLMFDARLAKQDIVVNLNQRIEDKLSPNYKKHISLQQVNLIAGESKDIHLCTGYVINAGNGLAAWTQYGLLPNQGVQMSFTGYLLDEEASL